MYAILSVSLHNLQFRNKEEWFTNDAKALAHHKSIAETVNAAIMDDDLFAKLKTISLRSPEKRQAITDLFQSYRKDFYRLRKLEEIYKSFITSKGFPR